MPIFFTICAPEASILVSNDLIDLLHYTPFFLAAAFLIFFK